MSTAGTTAHSGLCSSCSVQDKEDGWKEEQEKEIEGVRGGRVVQKAV